MEDTSQPVAVASATREHRSGRMSASELEEVRDLRAAGLSIADIATRLGRSKSSIHDALAPARLRKARQRELDPDAYRRRVERDKKRRLRARQKAAAEEAARAALHPALARQAPPEVFSTRDLADPEPPKPQISRPPEETRGARVFVFDSGETLDANRVLTDVRTGMPVGGQVVRRPRVYSKIDGEIGTLNRNDERRETIATFRALGLSDNGMCSYTVRGDRGNFDPDDPSDCRRVAHLTGLRVEVLREARANRRVIERLKSGEPLPEGWYA